MASESRHEPIPPAGTVSRTRAGRSDPRTAEDAWAARTSLALRGGSREALAEIYDRCAARLARDLARRTRRDDAFVLDCLQEMFMRLATHPPLVENEAALLAWMRLTALNVARNAIVSEARRTRREASRENAAPDHRDDDAPDDELVARLAAIDAVIGEDERTLLDLRFRRGLAVAAIARSLGTGTRRIESALRRALARARGLAGRDAGLSDGGGS